MESWDREKFRLLSLQERAILLNTLINKIFEKKMATKRDLEKAYKTTTK